MALIVARPFRPLSFKRNSMISSNMVVWLFVLCRHHHQAPLSQFYKIPSNEFATFRLSNQTRLKSLFFTSPWLSLFFSLKACHSIHPTYLPLAHLNSSRGLLRNETSNRILEDWIGWKPRAIILKRFEPQLFPLFTRLDSTRANPACLIDIESSRLIARHFSCATWSSTLRGVKANKWTNPVG